MGRPLRSAYYQLAGHPAYLDELEIQAGNDDAAVGAGTRGHASGNYEGAEEFMAVPDDGAQTAQVAGLEVTDDRGEVTYTAHLSDLPRPS